VRTIVAAALLLASCQHLTPKDSIEVLHDSVEAYNHAFRWKAYDRAATYRLPAERTAFIATYEDDQSSLQIEDYKVMRVNLIGDRAAHVTVRVRYLMLPSTVVQRSTVVQEWHKVGDDWLVEGERNPIRKLDLGAVPDHIDRLHGPNVSPEQEGETQVDITKEDPLFK